MVGVGNPSILKLIRSDEALTSMLPSTWDGRRKPGGGSGTKRELERILIYTSVGVK